MSQFDEKLQMTAMTLSSGEGVFMGSMLFGICSAMRKCLDNIASYQDMLEDEFDGNPGALAYLEAERENLSRLLQMVGLSDQVLKGAMGGERVHLITLLDGVMARYNKNLPPEDFLIVNADDSIFIRCNPFQAQQMLYDMLEAFALHRRPNEDKWNVFARSIVLQKNEFGILNIRDEQGANFNMLKLSVENEDLPLAGNYIPLQDCISLGMDLSIEMRQAVEWLGLAALNDCHVLVNRENPRNGLAILFPEVRSWDQGVDPLKYFGWQKPEQPKTILLVDDEDMIWDVISEMLQDLGYNVVLAGDGQEAIQIYGGNIGKIDLVIMDMLMPGMGGKEAFYILKGLDPKVKVLISSGYVSEDQIQDVMNDGAAGFLRKPYRMADLAKKIHAILKDT